jgi:hypothetical protein
MKLRPHETDLIGTWRRVGNTVEADSTAHRIDRLVKNQLRQLAQDSSGWDVLYQDPNDGRFWELTYPNSDWHGGGPPRLTCMPFNAAREKYGDVVGDSLLPQGQ